MILIKQFMICEGYVGESPFSTLKIDHSQRKDGSTLYFWQGNLLDQVPFDQLLLLEKQSQKLFAGQISDIQPKITYVRGVNFLSMQCVVAVNVNCDLDVPCID